MNGIDSASDEYTFTDVFSTRQADVRIEDPFSGERVGKLQLVCKVRQKGWFLVGVGI